MALLAEEPPSTKIDGNKEKTKSAPRQSKIKNYFKESREKFLPLASKISLLTKKVPLWISPDNANSDGLISKSAKRVRNFLMSGNNLAHGVILVLSFVVAVSNISDSRTAEAFFGDLVYVDPGTEEQIISEIDPYTPLIENDTKIAEKASVALAVKDGFTNASGSAVTQITSREEPLPDNSQSEVKYAVRAGDTLTGIGWKFGVKITTLKYINDSIGNINSLKPGTVLTVPARGYEVPQTLIAKKEKEKQTKLALAKRSTITRRTSLARAADNYDGSDDSGSSLGMPINHKGVTQGFSSRHTGVDYRADIGTPVRAAADGVVMAITGGWSGGYGLQVLVNHGGGLVTRYAHLSDTAVSVGDSVGQGQTIAYSGNSGRSTGPHLHFEKIINGRPVHPF